MARRRIGRRLKRRQQQQQQRLDEEETHMKEEEELRRVQSQKSMQSFLQDIEEEEEEDDDRKFILSKGEKAKNNGIDVMETHMEEESIAAYTTAPSNNDENRNNKFKKNKGAKDLLQLASKIEVFSYLSPEALADILEYVEYVEFKNVGDIIFDTDSLDGSMYAVVSGEVSMSLSIQHGGIGGTNDDGIKHSATNNNRHSSNRSESSDNDASSSSESNSTPSFSFQAGPGEVITSAFSVITSLIREYRLQAAFLSSPFPGVLMPENRSYGAENDDDYDPSAIVIPPGIDVQAKVSAPKTRLLRIPSRCFVVILEKFPSDVHRIAQTIVARLQRVTIQTLVRFLGLDASILGLTVHNKQKGQIPERIPRKSSEWKKLETLLDGDGSEKYESEEKLLEEALSAAACQLGFSSGHGDLLREGSSIVRSPPGSEIFRTGESTDAIYLVVRGSLEVGMDKNNDLIKSEKLLSNQDDERIMAKRTKLVSAAHDSVRLKTKTVGSKMKLLFRSGSGSFVGLFSVFTNDASLITVRNPLYAGSDAILLKIPAETFENVLSKHPRALIYCLSDIIDTIGDGANLCVSPPMYLLDWTLDWMHVEAGENIAIRGEPCDSMFVVLNGRLRTGNPMESPESTSDSDKKQLEQESFGRGATIGELEALTESNWEQNVFAVRHSELARVPMSLLTILMEIFPSAGVHFAKVVANHVQSRTRNSFPSLLPSYNLSISTIAVVPLSEEVGVSQFCMNLSDSLKAIAPTKHLTKTEVRSRVGHELFKYKNSILQVKMTRILGDIEENNRLVVYEADRKYTWWTKLSIQQADCVLILVDSKHAPEPKKVEECIEWAHKFKNVKIEMVVVQSSLAQEMSLAGEHASDDVNNWSESRPWITKHHLCRMPFSEHVKDIQRMCRRVTGQSIGLALGGGGARGLAHLGVIKALNEAGIPVDIVGGTSQGAFVGALLAKNPDDYEELEKSLRQMAANMASVKEKLLDLTFPLTSFFSGHRFNRGIQECIGDIRIQDLVLNFFCVSVDLRNSRQVVHTKGLAWKYVRASMSLSGYLPPISENKSLLVDGGYMNVVPGDVMAEFGAKKVIAVDVANVRVADYYEYGASLSGFWLLYNSWNPFVQTVKVPSMGDLNEMLSWVSSERLRKKIMTQVDLFLSPPVQDFGTLEYDKFDEIVQIGYEYAKPIVDSWAKKNMSVYTK